MALNSLKDLQISEEIRQDERLCPLVEKATELLIDELGPSVGIVAVNWTIDSQDRDFRIIELTISDWTGSASAQFSEDQVADESHLDWRLRRLWGDLLQIRSHRELDRLRMTVQSMADN